MFIEATEGLLTAAELYERRSAIAALVRRAIQLTTQGRAQVGIFGAGGTGKSTLASFLGGELDTDKEVGTYAESFTVERFRIGSERAGFFPWFRVRRGVDHCGMKSTEISLLERHFALLT